MILLAIEFTECGLTHAQEHELAITLRDDLLSSYAAGTDKLSFAVHERGKPYINNSEISYSVTHTDGCTGCAVSIPGVPLPIGVPLLPNTVTEGGVYLADTFNGSCELGVDFERISTDRDEARLSAIASRYFDNDEFSILESSDDKCAEFYRLWTEKESMVKCTGEGLSAIGFADTVEAEAMGFSIRQFTAVYREKRYSGTICRNEQILFF